jgi:hypothetical protein
MCPLQCIGCVIDVTLLHDAIGLWVFTSREGGAIENIVCLAAIALIRATLVLEVGAGSAARTREIANGSNLDDMSGSFCG